MVKIKTIKIVVPAKNVERILFWFQCYADKQIANALESVVGAYELC